MPKLSSGSGPYGLGAFGRGIGTNGPCGIGALTAKGGGIGTWPTGGGGGARGG